MNAIRDLERKYMEEIWEWVSSDEFSKDLLEIEQYIQSNYKDLNERYQIKNKLQKAAERLLFFYVHRKLEVKGVYPSPISSDLAFYTDDALVNIDAKTIDLDGNEGDDKYIQFGPHQISFSNKPFFARTISGKKFGGIVLPPGLPEIEPKKKIPCLTFFMGITYRDDGKLFSLSHIKLSCVPNGIIAREDFNNDLIINFKTYNYLKKDAANKIGVGYLPKPHNFAIPHTWIPFCLKGGAGNNDTWLDTTLNHPYNRYEPAIWRILDKKYHICLGGATARIEPQKVEQRKDGVGKPWLGVRKLDVKREGKKK